MEVMDATFLLQFIKQLDHQSNDRRFELLQRLLIKQQIPSRVHTYATGKNLIVDIGKGQEYFAISSHFDKVPFSGGANDNASAIAVCLRVLALHQAKNSDVAIRLLFFDEEETGLKGSSAYVSKFGIADLRCLINLEMVGNGSRFALWPLTEDCSTKNSIAKVFEQSAQLAAIPSARYDRIVTNTADHLPFKEAGLTDIFTITCITEADQLVGLEYKQALEQRLGQVQLAEIISKAPLFKHYHMPTDTFDTLNAQTIEMTANTIWKTLEYHGKTERI